jgi:hypothetical protein
VSGRPSRRTVSIARSGPRRRRRRGGAASWPRPDCAERLCQPAAGPAPTRRTARSPRARWPRQSCRGPPAGRQGEDRREPAPPRPRRQSVHSRRCRGRAGSTPGLRHRHGLRLRNAGSNERGAERLLGQLAQLTQDYLARGLDDHGVRQARYSESACDSALGIDNLRVARGCAPEETQGCPTLVPGVDAEEEHAITDSAVCGLEERRLTTARLAPGCPYVDYLSPAASGPDSNQPTGIRQAG